MTEKTTNASVPESRGETTQDAVIRPTLAHSTASQPSATAPNPAMAPTIECVVDTGQPRRDAMMSQVPAAVRAASIPAISTSGRSATTAGSRIPPRIVFVTCPPTR